MDIAGFEELKKIIAEKDQLKILARYSELMTDTVNRIIELEGRDDDSFCLENIKNQKNILEKAELLFDSLKGETIDFEKAELSLENFITELKILENFIKENLNK